MCIRDSSYAWKTQNINILIRFGENISDKTALVTRIIPQNIKFYGDVSVASNVTWQERINQLFEAYNKEHCIK